MKTFRLKYSTRAVADLDHLAAFAIGVNTPDFARRYVAKLRNEVESLSYLADMLPKSKYRLPLLYHPEAKTIPIGNNRLTGPRATGRGTGREVIAAQEQNDYKRKQTNILKHI